ncbi:MAG: hypothetical protein ACOVP7_10490 [Lacibacter sp.]
MFKKLFNAFSGGKEENDIDLSLGYSRLNEFKNYLLKKDYAAFEKEYEQLDWDAKTLLNEGIGLSPLFERPIADWAATMPSSYVAHLFAGVSFTLQAWTARTGALGSEVSDERAQLFFDFLEKAAEHLKIADELNPDDAEVCARTIRVYMGLGVEREVTEGYFLAANSIQQGHFMAHMLMASYLTPKWRGSLDELYDFSNTQYEESNSSLLVTLLLFAITEEWLYYTITDEKELENNFFKNEELKATLKTIYSEYSDDGKNSLLIPYAYNYFAFLFHMFNESELARSAAAHIKGKMTTYPWAYIGFDKNKQLESL